MRPRPCCRAVILALACQLLAVAAGCSSDEPKGRAAPKAGELVKVFNPGKDGAVNGIALRGDGTLFVSTSRDVRAIPREGKHETVMTQALGNLVTGKDVIYGLGIRDGVVYEFGPGGQRQVALANAPEEAGGPTDPGLDEPYSLAWDPKSETVLVADQYKVDRIDPRTRHIQTVTGSRNEEPAPRAKDVSARDARYVRIDDIAVDPTDGALVVSAGDFYRIDPSSGLVTLLPAKTPGIGRSGLAFDARSGDLFFGTEDLQGHGRLYRLARDGTLTIIIKYLEKSIRALAVDSNDGAVYIAVREGVFVCGTPAPEKCDLKD